MDVLVFAMDDGLQSHAVQAASVLRQADMAVDLQLEARKVRNRPVTVPLAPSVR